MNTILFTTAIPPKEIEKLISTFVSEGNGLHTGPVKFDNKYAKLDASLRVDLSGSKAKYAFGALEFGPIDALLSIKEFRVKIDWHNVLKIPRKLCIHLKDPCGNTIIKECIHFDLGVTELVLINNLPLRERIDLRLLDIAFRDKGSSDYALTGDIAIISTLVELFTAGFIRGMVAQVHDFVERLLKSVFGNGALAKLFIEILKAVFKIFDLAVGVVMDLVSLALRPLDELLHQLFPEQLEVTLKKDAFPKQFPIVNKTNSRPAVTIPISVPPKVTLIQSGLQLEVYS